MSGIAGDDSAVELARLDEKIAENDAQDTPNARWRAAYAVYEKAQLIERRDGEEAALPLYADVVRRLEGSSEAGPRALLISALNIVAVIHDSHGRDIESRAVAEALVNEHFDDAPMEAGEAVANATILLAWHLRQAGEDNRVLELSGRLVERYGQPGVPGHRRTAAIAKDGIAWILGEAGRTDEAIRLYDQVIQDLDDAAELELRIHLARALTRKASLLSDKGLLEERDALCEAVVRRFAGSEDPKIAENVAWAQMVLDEYATRPRRKRLRRRR